MAYIELLVIVLLLLLINITKWIKLLIFRYALERKKFKKLRCKQNMIIKQLKQRQYMQHTIDTKNMIKKIQTLDTSTIKLIEFAKQLQLIKLPKYVLHNIKGIDYDINQLDENMIVVLSYYTHFVTTKFQLLL